MKDHWEAIDKFKIRKIININEFIWMSAMVKKSKKINTVESDLRDILDVVKYHRYHLEALGQFLGNLEEFFKIKIQMTKKVKVSRKVNEIRR